MEEKDYGMENYDSYLYEDQLDQEQDLALDDYLFQKQLDERAETFDALDYESKMTEQLIDDIYDKM